MTTAHSPRSARKILLIGLIIANLSFAWNLIQLASRPVSVVDLEQEVTSLEQDRDQLESILAQNQSDFEKEVISRNELHLQNIGETIVQYPIPSPIPSLPPESTKSAQPIIAQWFEIIF